MNGFTPRLMSAALLGAGMLVAGCTPAAAPSPTSAPPAPTSVSAAPTSAPAAKPTAAATSVAAAAPTAAPKPTTVPAPATASATKQITILQTSELNTFDPAGLCCGHEENVALQIFDTLVWFDHNEQPDPKIATSWKSLDPSTWEVKLRPNVKFTNGEPVNADAVVESFNYMSKGPETAGNFETWDHLEKVDDLTVRVKTKVPDARFVTTAIWLALIPPSILRADPSSLAQHPIGSGPYKLVEWVKGDHITMEANPDYWRGKPKIDRVTWKTVPEASARVAALQSGQADMIVGVPPEAVDALDKGARTKTVSVPGIRNPTFIFDTRTPPFNDVRVRQALNYAVDKESIIRNILGGRAALQSTYTNSFMFGHNADVKAYPFDAAKAKELLSQAGFPNGFDTEIQSPAGRWVKDVEVSQAIVDMLGKVGVRAKLSTSAYGTFFPAWAKGTFTGLSLVGTETLGDPDQVVALFMYSKGPLSKYFSDAKIDQMYEQEIQEFDATKRALQLNALEAYVHDAAPWLFTYFQADIYGVNKNLSWLPPQDERIILWDADLAT
jgi:peptide/nickel transport system substrate-binding protein